MLKQQLKEKLAALAHDQWSGWMKYLFSKSFTEDNGDVTIPEEFVRRWKRQIDTSYEDLSEQEKNSDRVEADKYLEIIEDEVIDDVFDFLWDTPDNLYDEYLDKIREEGWCEVKIEDEE